MVYRPQKHRLDLFAEVIADEITSEATNNLLTVSDTAALLRVSPEWLASGRCRGWGPPFIKLSPLKVRYRREDLIKWLHERAARSTAEWRQRTSRPAPQYAEGRAPGRPRKAATADQTTIE